MLLALPINYYDTKAEIASFKATQSTVDNARDFKDIDNQNALENAALTQKVIEMNQWLAKTQYYKKSTCWSLWIPGEVLELKPIR